MSSALGAIGVAAVTSFMLVRRAISLRAASSVVRCITFDLDDTLWECEPVITRATKEFMTFLEKQFPAIFERYPTNRAWRELSNSVCKSGVCVNSHDLTEVRKASLRVAAVECGMDDPEVVVEEGFKAFIEARNNVEDFILPGAINILTRIRASGIVVGALSNGNADVFSIPSLAPLFDFAVSPSTAGAKKPDLSPFRLALKMAGCTKLSMIHVGDSLHSDVWPAQAFGVYKAVWVKSGSVWSGTAPSCLSEVEHKCAPGKADLEVANLPELEAKLVEWGVIK